MAVAYVLDAHVRTPAGTALVTPPLFVLRLLLLMAATVAASYSR